MRLARTLISTLSVSLISSLIVQPAQSQVTPDGTLPTSVEQLQQLMQINGGQREGNNLFHSFDEFSIPDGMEAVFENALDIENIFTRITGADPSTINGILKTQGSANFFLVNPNGIVFGENAQLDVGGSFIATTANSIKFKDGTEFLANDSTSDPVLTMNVPIGLGFGSNNGSITVKGTGNQITRDSFFAPIQFDRAPVGVSVQEGQTLALVGNGLDFNGGVVATESGEVYLTSIEAGAVGISQSENRITLFDNGVTKYQDINLTQQSIIWSNGDKVGTISLVGKDINLGDASFVLVQNRGDVSSSSIDIQSKSLTLSGNSPDGNISSNIRSETFGNGVSENINISAEQLFLRNSGRIQTSTSSNAMASSINVKVSALADLNRGSVNAVTFAQGNAGNINFSADQIRLTNIGVISAATLGSGNGGEVDINADLIEVIGNPETQDNSTIGTSSFGSGNAGTVTLNTQQLKVTNGGTIASSSLGTGSGGNLTINASQSVETNGINEKLGNSIIATRVEPASEIVRQAVGLPEIPTGNAGNLTINTPSLNVFEEGIISVENQGTGNAGTLTINADNLNLDRAGSITAAAESGIGGNIELNTQNLNITKDSQITASAGGNEAGGNITINTTHLTAKTDNQITASAFEGDGGNININATDSLSLNDRDSISAASEAGEGGNIKLNTEQLRIKNNSQISTSASGEGNGGNIEITAGTLLAINDSDITATAIRGNGGNITITANGILGIEEREATPGNGTSDIDASSEFGEDGKVIITNPQVLIQDPIIAIREINFSEPDEQLENKCWDENSARRNPQLVYTGRGGFSAEPNEFSDPEQYIPAPGYVAPPEGQTEDGDFPIWEEGDPLIEANAIRVDKNGDIYFVAELSQQSAESLLCTVSEEEEEIKN